MRVGQRPGCGHATPEYRLEARRAQEDNLRALAEAINDTARMARNTVTAALVVALYLGLTLLSSSDLNVFLNGRVTIPQAGQGISVVQSYIFAPPVFLFLHVQALLLLETLARKVRVYDQEVDQLIPAAAPLSGMAERLRLYPGGAQSRGVRPGANGSLAEHRRRAAGAVVPDRPVVRALSEPLDHRLSPHLGLHRPGLRLALSPPGVRPRLRCGSAMEAEAYWRCPMVREGSSVSADGSAIDSGLAAEPGRGGSA